MESTSEIISENIEKTEDIPTGNEKILFVDDEEILAHIGKSMLETLGYSVTAKSDSSEALRLFQSNPAQFDLVITDQTMPNIPGSELAKQLLKIRSDIPIIICTGYSSMINEAAAKKMAAMGATTIITYRNREKGEKALDEIREETGNPKDYKFNLYVAPSDRYR